MYSTHEGYNDSIHGYYLEDLKVGMSASHAKTVTETDVVMFAGLTGDNNPVHCNEVFAAQTQVQGSHRPWHVLRGSDLLRGGHPSTRTGLYLRGPATALHGASADWRYRHGYLHYPGDQSGTPASHHEHDLHRAGQDRGRGKRHLPGEPPQPLRDFKSERRTASPDGEPYPYSSMITRNPVIASRWSGLRGRRLAERNSPGPLFQEPPRVTRRPSLVRLSEQPCSWPP